VPNKLSDSEDDPFNGILYAFPSPWRDGLSIATTRHSVIRLGSQSTGTRTIANSNEDYPPEILTFTDGQSSTAYPVMTLTTFDWLDENLGGIVVVPYSTVLEVTSPGDYHGHSLAKVSYVTRYISVPVSCTNHEEPIEAQFLLLENQNG
jgi:hypothetical protein